MNLRLAMILKEDTRCTNHKSENSKKYTIGFY